MTASPGDDRMVAAIEALARDAAPGLLSHAFDDACAEVKTILQRRLVDALLEEAASAETARRSPPERARSTRVDHGEQRASSPMSGDDGASWRSHHRTAPRAQSAEPGLYVYGVTSVDARRVSGLTGVEGSPTYPIVLGDLVAAVSDVSGHRHDWGTGDDGQPDLALLAPRLEEHEKVLELILEHGSVLPMRFGTLYTSRSAVTEQLAMQGPTIRAALDRVDGKVEWGLTVSWDVQRLADSLAAEDARDGTTTLRPKDSPGRAYLSTREAEKARADLIAERRGRLSCDLHRAIGAVAVESVLHASPAAGKVDDGPATLLKSSYLVDRSRRAAFEDTIVQLLNDNEQLSLAGELTGPWPPYNFSDLQLLGALA
ncbi:MAG: GvpL/GvpF family gas vesicle protein [Actinomycetota bacterium]|nr:GvpL/GvpF family gas vesicle protein [Actinomycetota bacterium]